MTVYIDGQPAWGIRPLRAAEGEVVADLVGLARLSSGDDGRYLVAWAAGAPLGHGPVQRPITATILAYISSSPTVGCQPRACSFAVSRSILRVGR